MVVVGEGKGRCMSVLHGHRIARVLTKHVQFGYKIIFNK
jgi:hypothetical protein